MESSITHAIDGEYIREWLVLGPFFPDDLEKDFLADVGGESNIEPKEGDIVTTEDGVTLTWKRYESKGDVVNLLDAVGNYEYATAYAFCILQSEEAGDAEIRLGSDDGVAVWVNGDRVHLFPSNRSVSLDQDVFEVDLKAGANLCLVKVFQRTQDWGFAVRALPPQRAVVSGIITDEAGKPIPNADIRLEQACPRAERRDGKIARTMTDSSGSYRLNIYPVCGEYSLFVTKEDLESWQFDIQLDEGERRTLNLTLKEEVSIEGTLLMLDDATPHVAVPVQAIQDGKVIATKLSDEGGRYRFINLKPGEYQVRCQVLGGYVYYGDEKVGKRESQKAGESESGTTLDEPISLSAHKPTSLQVEQDGALRNINFRLAPFKKGIWNNYSYLDGLRRDDEIYTLYCDPGGVMWFGTYIGVFRYDGKEFIHLTTRDGLPHNNVNAIHCDPDGVVWFGTTGGVSRYIPPHSPLAKGSKGGFVNLTTEDGLAHNNVNTIHCDPDGVMWFGTQGGVSRYIPPRSPLAEEGSKGGFVNLTTEDGLASNYVRAIHRDPDGVMWFATGGWAVENGAGISRYDGREFVNFTTEDGLAHNNVWAIHCDPDGVMWFGTRGGVSRYIPPHSPLAKGGFVNLTTKDGLACNDIRAIHRDSDGIMWFAAYGVGVSRYIPPHSPLAKGGSKGGFVNFTTKDGLAGNGVMSIHSDPDGVMWFGAWLGGVSRYDPNAFVTFTTKDGLASNEVNAIHRDPDGVVWFATGGFFHEGGGISSYDSKGMGDFPHFVNLTTKDGLVDERVQTIYRGPDGVVWFGKGRFSGTATGVFRYDGKELVNFTTKDGLPHNNVWAINRDPDGVMWFGTTGGVSRYIPPHSPLAKGESKGGFVNFTTKDGLAHNNVDAIHCDPDGMMWFGTYGGVSRYIPPHSPLAKGGSKGRFVNLTTEDGLACNEVHAIYRDPDGAMWFGTSVGGVSRYDGMEFVNLTREDGLADNYVNAIYRDPDGVMWFGTDGGVSVYDGVAWASLDTRDGLAGRYVGSILQDPDGSLWFATQDGGVTRYRPSNTPPRVYIVSVTTDQTYRDLSAIPAFTPGTRVTIEYDSIDFKTLPEKRQYRCRIREIDSDWRKPTGSISYDFIFDKPGIYTFEVQAIDRDLNYSEPASVKLEVIPDPRNHQIAQLKGELAERERAEMERMQQELDDARQIQQSLLPDRPPEIAGFEIAGISNPAREVSGDFYSYLSLGDNTGIVLADVTGKSVKAAMVAALADGMLHSEVEERESVWDSPGKILAKLNIRLQPRLIRGMYTAMSLGIIQPTGKRLIFSNAGMPYPIVKRGNEVWELEVIGMPLGLMSGAEYEDMSVELEDGDFVIFHSDGVIEATNATDEMYQTERLLEVVKEADAGVSAQEMVDLIVEDVTEFAGGAELSDDMTIVAMRCSG